MDDFEEGHPGYDFLLDIDGREQYIEVKGSKKNTYHIKPQQFLLALKCYCQNDEAKYRLLLMNEYGVALDCDSVISSMCDERIELVPWAVRMA
jgi:hypothetical protein